MDVLEMRAGVLEAVERARADGTPTLIEAQCYRFMGHSMSDPVSGVYRTREEVEEQRAKDPIRRFADQLEEAGLLTEDELRAIDDRVHAEVEEAAAFADQSPEPDPSTLREHVYSDTDVSGRLFFDRAARDARSAGADEAE
jgi:TPP-dependent pyruvate/acetoin dehydrogenase alpha subunit